MPEVVPMPNQRERLVRRLREARAKRERGDAQWQNGFWEEATALAEARAGFEENQAFSRWLTENGLDYGSHDRTAFVNLGKRPELLREVLAETESRSPRRIWQEAEERYRLEEEVNSRVDRSVNTRIDPEERAAIRERLRPVVAEAIQEERAQRQAQRQSRTQLPASHGPDLTEAAREQQAKLLRWVDELDRSMPRFVDVRQHLQWTTKESLVGTLRNVALTATEFANKLEGDDHTTEEIENA